VNATINLLYKLVHDSNLASVDWSYIEGALNLAELNNSDQQHNDALCGDTYAKRDYRSQDVHMRHSQVAAIRR
jgi:hypothetical protein